MYRKLWVAASRGDIATVKERLDAGDNINSVEPNVRHASVWLPGQIAA